MHSLMDIEVTPFPNLPLYFTVYRIYSNHIVSARCTMLLITLKKFQDRRIRQRRPPSEIDAVKTDEPSKDDTIVAFESCSTMEAVLKPHERMKHPVADDAVLHVGRKYQLPDLLELVARTRRKATGAMFPHEIS